jgi:dephospho-CoA kinase
MIIGLTGGIASGKSTVSNILKELGAKVIDADLISREVMQKGSGVWHTVVESFGTEIIDDGDINRKKLGSIVFSDKSKLNLLNSITHPAIIYEIEKRILQLQNQNENPLIVIDAAILIEMGLNRLADEIWVVDVDKQTQVDRIMQRDNVKLQEALNRIDAQMPANQRLKYADYVINNNRQIHQVKNDLQSKVKNYLKR